MAHKDLETIDPRPLQVSTPSLISQVSTSDLSNCLEDDATQISMSQMSGSLPMLARAQTSPERRLTAEKRRIRRVGVLADSARAVVEQGEMEAMERRRLEEKHNKEVAAFRQCRAERNRELSSLRMAIDRGNDIMQSLVTVLLQRTGSSGGSWWNGQRSGAPIGSCGKVDEEEEGGR
uniref:Uncharacterized protein n=1 Tax=Sphaerodactylus townsendi TaxID=933632 RepID=A0ACB8EMN2_9SAUR